MVDGESPYFRYCAETSLSPLLFAKYNDPSACNLLIICGYLVMC